MPVQKPVLTPPQGGETATSSKGSSFELKVDSSQSGGDYGAVLWTVVAGEEPPLHTHSREDELVYVLEGTVTLIEDAAQTALQAGDCAAFPKGTGNGHHMINRSGVTAVYLEVGSRSPDDLTTCSDIDMMSANADGRFVHKDGTPYVER